MTPVPEATVDTILIIVVSAVAVPCVDPAAEYVATELRIKPVFAVMLAAVTLVNTPVVAPILPTFAFAVTLNELSVPTLVIFGCAAVVTVPAVVALVAVVALPAFVAYVALATVPETLAPATAFAVVAYATAPLTLDPVNEAKFAPDNPAAKVADEPIVLFQVPTVMVPTFARLLAFVRLAWLFAVIVTAVVAEVALPALVA